MMTDHRRMLADLLDLLHGYGLFTRSDADFISAQDIAEFDSRMQQAIEALADAEEAEADAYSGPSLDYITSELERKVNDIDCLLFRLRALADQSTR